MQCTWALRHEPAHKLRSLWISVLEICSLIDHRNDYDHGGCHPWTRSITRGDSCGGKDFVWNLLNDIPSLVWALKQRNKKRETLDTPTVSWLKIKNDSSKQTYPCRYLFIRGRRIRSTLKAHKKSLTLPRKENTYNLFHAGEWNSRLLFKGFL